MAADVYGVSPHTGRGGWTWYTGSAGWMYQLIVESFLGIHREGDLLRLEPCVPEEWKSFTFHYLYRESVYHNTVLQDEGQEATVTVDGSDQASGSIQLVDDKSEHTVVVKLAAHPELLPVNVSKP
jgi:cyclic beta-1,2-glucan synthetase